jgi:hypothetical protein
MAARAARAARDRYILDLKCHQCGREGIAYISVIAEPRRRLRLAIDKVTEGFAVLEDYQSFECVACKVQVSAHIGELKGRLSRRPRSRRHAP